MAFKKIMSLSLSVCLMLATTTSVVFAKNNVENKTAKVSTSKKLVKLKPINLKKSNLSIKKCSPKVKDNKIVVDPGYFNTKQKLGVLKDAATNNPPVAGLEPYILNQDSLDANGNLTTNSLIAWVWSNNGQNYTYDPDGDAIIDMEVGGIPNGSIIGYLNDGTKNYGFVTKITTVGEYNLTFQCEDSKNAWSNVAQYTFDIVNPSNKPVNTTPSVQWQKTYEDSTSNIGSNSVQPTDDGGYLIGGCINYGSPYLMKIDSQGNKVWDKTINVPNSKNSSISSIKPTGDGNYIIIGNKGYIAKIDPNGNIIWEKSDTTTEELEYSEIIQTSDGNFAIVGDESTQNNKFDVYLLKIDGSGNKIFEKTIGNADNDFGASIKQTVDGGYIILDTNIGNATDQPYLIKTDRYGNTLWQQGYTISKSYFTGTSNSDCLKITSDGGYIFADGAVLVKTNSSGSLEFQKGFNNEKINGVELTPDGYMLANYNFGTSSNGNKMFTDILKLDAQGNSTWNYTTNEYNSDDYAENIKATNDSGYIVVGTVRPSAGASVSKEYIKIEKVK
ncbi:hypothetical protein [Clostridium felsineum]|uniref:hypothetical protein n=1 Tax=Clostridium felsineum TaxID=36839 RepID=UPI00098C14A0|nr:hypothetical protein [Clostridium felsineum]URZ18186.1 hypothetical protein CLFE_042410 [Clostridium felsineum DSM 794]